MGSDERMKCPECGEKFEPRGFRTHLQQGEGYSAAESRAEFERQKAGENSDPVDLPGTGAIAPDSGDDSPGRAQGSRGAFVGPDETARAADDPEVRELDRQVEKTRRKAELERLREVIEKDGDNGADTMEMILALSEAGLLDGGGDNSRELAALRSEIRNLARETSRDGGGGGDRDRDRGGAGGGGVSIQGDTDPLSVALASGVDDTEVLTSLARASPEVEKAKLEFKRESARWQHRREFIDDVVDRLTSADVVDGLVRAGVSMATDSNGAENGASGSVGGDVAVAEGAEGAEGDGDSDGSSDVRPPSAQRLARKKVDDEPSAATGEFRGPPPETEGAETGVSE